MIWKSKIAGAASAFTLIAAAHLLAGAAPAASGSAPPPGPGLDLIKERCSFCHTSASIFERHKTRADWAATVSAMADRGADLSPEEMDTIIDYLAKNYAAGPAPAATDSKGAS